MIYLDNNATTKPTARVVTAMLHYLTDCYYNASALTSAFTDADKPRREAAAEMSKLLNAEEPDCFTFTSGATESNNWVLSSIAKGHRDGCILISAIEHPSVSVPAAELASVGAKAREVPVDARGLIRMDALRDALKSGTSLVSIMAANNETGVVEPIPEIGRLVHELCPSAIFHTDATQAIGRIPIDLQGAWQDVDLLSFSAHKFHGPKGIGGLYIRPAIDLSAMIRGGGQEQGRRSGTSNTPALAGLASAAADARPFENEVIRSLRDGFEAKLQDARPNVMIHSRDVPRLPNTSCFSLPDVNGEQLAERLAASGIIVGTGAACSSGAIDGSKTLRAMGLPHGIVMSCLRVSLSRSSTAAELDALLSAITHGCVNQPV